MLGTRSQADAVPSEDTFSRARSLDEEDRNSARIGFCIGSIVLDVQSETIHGAEV